MHLPKDIKGWAKVAAVIAAVAGLYVLYTLFFPTLDPQQLLDDFSTTLGQWTYVIVAVFAFLETGAFVGLVAPGETVVVLGGAVAGQGETSLWLTIALVWLGAFLGDTVSFWLGRRLGRGFVIRQGPRFRITPERFAQVEAYFESHGGKTILIGRFIGIIRALAPFVAGSSGMRYGAMAPYSILGTGLWASFFTLLGYVASQNLDAVVSAAERGFLYFALIVGIIVGAVVAIRFLRVAANRQRAVAAMERRPLLRPLVAFGRRVAPQARFLWERLTPGGLGIELTAPLAVLAVGSFVFIAYANILGTDPGPTGADMTASGWAADINTAWLTSVMEVVTDFGSPVAVVAVTLVAACAFGFGRHWDEMTITIAGIVLLLIAVPEFKDLVDRPRPEGGLVEAGGASYPSGHAAYSVIYSWIAIAATIRLRPGLSGGTVLLILGIAMTALVGLSRVYLGVHYLSDVSGGWALGASAFAIAASVVVVVSFFRQNRRRGP